MGPKRIDRPKSMGAVREEESEGSFKSTKTNRNSIPRVPSPLTTTETSNLSNRQSQDTYSQVENFRKSMGSSREEGSDGSFRSTRTGKNSISGRVSPPIPVDAAIPSNLPGHNTHSQVENIRNLPLTNLDFPAAGIGRSLSAASRVSIHQRDNSEDSQRKSRPVSTSIKSLATESDHVSDALMENLETMEKDTRALAEAHSKESGGGNNANFTKLVQSNLALANTAQSSVNMYKKLTEQIHAMAEKVNAVQFENQRLSEANAKSFHDSAEKTHKLLELVS